MRQDDAVTGQEASSWPTNHHGAETDKEPKSVYSEKVMEHFGNPVCGDIMELSLDVEDGVIKDAKFRTFGCGAAIATSSMVTELVKGKTIDEALEVSNKAVVEALGVCRR